MRLRVSVSDDEDESILTAVVISTPSNHVLFPATPTLRGEDAARVQREMRGDGTLDQSEIERRRHGIVKRLQRFRRVDVTLDAAPKALASSCPSCGAEIVDNLTRVEALEAASVNVLRAIYLAHMG